MTTGFLEQRFARGETEVLGVDESREYVDDIDGDGMMTRSREVANGWA